MIMVRKSPRLPPTRPKRYVYFNFVPRLSNVSDPSIVSLDYPVTSRNPHSLFWGWVEGRNGGVESRWHRCYQNGLGRSRRRCYRATSEFSKNNFSIFWKIFSKLHFELDRKAECPFDICRQSVGRLYSRNHAGSIYPSPKCNQMCAEKWILPVRFDFRLLHSDRQSWLNNATFFSQSRLPGFALRRPPVL